MSDLIDDTPQGANAPEFTVSELSGAVKRTIEGAFSRVRVRGEVGRVSRPASGHLYLDLKDDRAVIAGVIWKGVAAGLRTRPEEGMEVIATGRLTTFPGASKYQIVIDSIAPAGVGALMAMLERRKAALAAEGLFAAGAKRRLPFLPDVIGVVTSPSGAVIRDILHRLRERFPRQVLIWPVTVQGEKSAAEVAAAIRGFNAIRPGGPVPRPDLLIVARGGGSLEDLWGFNEEIVVRAAADSTIPLISAVGHETDTTLIDHAADVRAPTPTAAAEMAVPVRAELSATLAGLEERRRRALFRALEQNRQRLRDLARALPRADAIVGERRQRHDAVGPRLDRALHAFVQRKRIALATGPAGRFGPQQLRTGLARHRDKLDVQATSLRRALVLRIERARGLLAQQRLRVQPLQAVAAEDRARLDRAAAALSRLGVAEIDRQRRRLDALDRVRLTVGYTATLRRGFAVVRGDGKVVSGVAPARAAGALEIEFADGRLAVTADADAAPPPKRARRRRDDPQGSLF